MTPEMRSGLAAVSEIPVMRFYDMLIWATESKAEDDPDEPVAALMAQMRRDFLKFEDGSAANAELVLYSMTSVAQSVMQDSVKDPEMYRQLYEMMPLYRTMTILGAWGINKQICAFLPSQLHQLTQADWWREYTTDYVIKKFMPWSVYFSLEGLMTPEGNTAPFGGMFAGFELVDGRLKLYCQHCPRNRETDFSLEQYYKFDFAPGQTLAEVFDNYRFEMPYNKLLCKEIMEGAQDPSLDAFERMMRQSGQAVASRLFPLLIGWLSEEEFDHRYFTMDTDEITFKSIREKKVSVPFGLTKEQIQTHLDRPVAYIDLMRYRSNLTATAN